MDIARQLEHVANMNAEDKPEGVTLSVPQVKTLYKKWELMSRNHGSKVKFAEFLDTVQPTFKMDNAVVVEWEGMFLCIEQDGYSHT